NFKKVDIIKVPKSVKKVDDFCFYESIKRGKVMFEDIENVEISELAF
ncbi:Hypothetical protein EIN_241720, partial [Entamoeba invadens IP1]